MIFATRYLGTSVDKHWPGELGPRWSRENEWYVSGCANNSILSLFCTPACSKQFSVISTLVRLILGHWFIRRLRDFIVENARNYHLNLYLADSVTLQWHGVGARTIAKVRQFAIGKVQSNLHYPDFSIIRTFSRPPIWSWILISHDQDP